MTSSGTTKAVGRAQPVTLECAPRYVHEVTEELTRVVTGKEGLLGYGDYWELNLDARGSIKQFTVYHVGRTLWPLGGTRFNIGADFK